MKVLVCGSREYYKIETLFNYLDQFHDKFGITLLIEGGARGADRFAAAWALERKIKFLEYPANWEIYGKTAGFKRNQQMIDQNPDAVIVFYYTPSVPSSGTKHCVNLALTKNIPVYYGHQPL